MSKQKNDVKDPYELIIEAIDDGAYKPGDRLVEAELAEIFGVSTISFWQAIGLFFLAKLFFGVGSTPGRHKSKDGKFRRAKLKDKSVRYQGFRKYWDEEGKDAYERFQTSQNNGPSHESS